MGRIGKRARSVEFVLVATGFAATLAYGCFMAAGRPEAVADLFDSWVYNGALALAAAVCLLQARRSHELRGAWLSFGLGLAAWTLGDVYWTLALSDLEQTPYPSLADAGYLLALPGLFTGIALIVKARSGHFPLASWVDGAVGALASAALITAILAPALIGLTDGDAATVLTNLAYPVGDLLLIAFIVWALIVTGRKAAGTLLLLGAGLFMWAGADIVYLYAEATSNPNLGWIDVLWPLGALVMASAAPFSDLRPAPSRSRYRISLVVPLLSTLTAMIVLVWDHFDRIHAVSVWLAAATIAAVAVRLVLSARENDRLVASLHRETVTDPLTGLANRRRLFDDLETFLAPGRVLGPALFALYDLDGFKAYNDAFGHPAGDALLRRLGLKLAEAVAPYAIAYRLGGDEFCVLAHGETDVTVFGERARAALGEVGEGFAIDASGGIVELPREARTASDVVRLADDRMYAEKGRRSTRADRQTQEALMRVLREREPSLEGHLAGVAELAQRTARALSLGGEQVDLICRAAELHDVGKIAIPDAILGKPGPLDAEEWELMRRHTVIGEKILGAAPALVPVARLVRSSHERWDGRGYPDGLAGEAIPLGARIIFICDAFDAMTTDRPYRRALSDDEALAELRRNAGTQFDPELVGVFCAVYDGEPAPSALARR